jgi:hypothetical protein
MEVIAEGRRSHRVSQEIIRHNYPWTEVKANLYEVKICYPWRFGGEHISGAG